MKINLREYLFALILVAIATGICFAMFPFFELTNLVMIYLLGTLVVASRGSKGPAALSSALSVFCFDFFFVPPRFSLAVTDVQYVFTFVVMFAAAMIISRLTIRLRSEAREARQGQKTMATMYEFSQKLSDAHDVDDVLDVAVAHIVQTFAIDAVAYIPDGDGRLKEKGRLAGSDKTNEKNQAVAHWVYDTGQPAGWGTDSLPQSNALFIPIPGAETTVGVLCLTPRDHDMPLPPHRRKLLDSFAHQIGMTLEVERLQENARKAAVEIETERLRSALLSSVSHDFRTPLTAIVGSASTLRQPGTNLTAHNAQELLENIQNEGERLSRLVQNLLETTRLESGVVIASKELYPLEEVLGSALERLERSLKGRNIEVKISEDLPPIPMDCLLIEQVFINLLENAVRHTSPGTSIEISADKKNETVEIAVADEGPGLKKEELELIFQKFYHGQSSPGVGLGLAICKAIINAHNGKIWAENRPEKGAVFRFVLPLGE